MQILPFSILDILPGMFWRFLETKKQTPKQEDFDLLSYECHYDHWYIYLLYFNQFFLWFNKSFNIFLQQKFTFSILKFCLHYSLYTLFLSSECLVVSVCMYVLIKVKTSEPIGTKFYVGIHMSLGRFMDVNSHVPGNVYGCEFTCPWEGLWMFKISKFASNKVRLSLNVENPRFFYYQNPQLLDLILLYNVHN